MSPGQSGSVDRVIPHDVNQDHEIILWEALVVTQMQAKREEERVPAWAQTLLDAQKESIQRLKSFEKEIKDRETCEEETGAFPCARIQVQMEPDSV